MSGRFAGAVCLVSLLSLSACSGGVPEDTSDLESDVGIADSSITDIGSTADVGSCDYDCDSVVHDSANDIELDLQSANDSPDEPGYEPDTPTDSDQPDAESPVKTTNLLDQTLFLIVTTADLADPFVELAAWKTQKGVPTKVVTMDDVLATAPSDDSAEALRHVLKSFWSDGGRYVLLAGDHPKVPRREVHCEAYNAAEDVNLDDDVAADLYYADLDGTWDGDDDGTYGEPEDGLGLMTLELFVGRVPLATIQDARNYVAKVLLYERPPHTDYQDTAIFLGEVVAYMAEIPICSTTYFESSIDYCFPEDIDITKIYDFECGDFPGAIDNTDSAQKAIWQSADSHIIMDLGHGNQKTLGALSISTLTDIAPTKRPAVFLTCQCNTCEFDYDSEVACEAFLRRDWGGVIYVGNSDFGVGFPWESLFFEAFLLDLYDAPGITVGELFANTLSTFGIDSGGDPDEPLSDYRWTLFTLHLFGDPTLAIWTAMPVTASVEVLDQATDSWKIRVTSGDSPVGRADVAVYSANVGLFVQTTGDDGIATFVFGDGAGPTGDVTVTATGPTIVPAVLKL